MAEKNVRFLVTEINKLLGTDFNMISFDSLPKNNLIQVCADCLASLDALPKVDVERNTEESLTKILETITNMKIPLPDHTNLNDFTNGIIQGKRSIIHSTLYWILSNQNEVRKRAYFSKYLKKVPMPPEFLSDPEIHHLMTIYDNKIQEFKNIHQEKTKYEKMGNATLELRKEMERVFDDMKKVNDQLVKQKPKVDNISNRESLLVTIKAYRNEVTQEKTILKQMDEQKDAIKELKMKLKKMEDEYEKQKMLRLGSGDLISRLNDEVNAFRILVTERLPQEIAVNRKQIELMTKIVSEPMPSQAELAELQNDVDNMTHELDTLMGTAFLNNDPKDDKLAQFRQHVTVTANNKQMAADALLEVKEELNMLRRKVEENDNILHSTIGGKMPQGDELKQYVSRLRAQSVIYKERRIELNEMQTELGVLNRTLEILKKENNHLIDAWDTKVVKSDNKLQDIKNIPENMHELINACKDMAKQLNNKRSEANFVRQELHKLRTSTEELTKKHERAKEIYESSVSNFNAAIKKLETDVKELEQKISSEEDEWKKITKEIEHKEEILHRLSDDSAFDEDNKKSQKDILNEQILEQTQILNNLNEEMKKIMSQKEEREQQVIMWHSTLELLKCKQQCQNES